MKHEIYPDLLKLPDTADRAELLWCAAVASLADSFEMRVMARAINTAINIAVRELMAKGPDQGGQ